MDWALVIPIVLLVVLIAAFAIYLWATYNSLVGLKARIDEAWNDITAERTRRADLVPALVEKVKGFATHETGVFEAVTRARTETLRASSPGDATSAENHLQQALRSVFAAAEAYPQLQASPGFLQVQADLVESEERIRASRRFYNGGVREFNARIGVFPNKLFARRLGFTRRDFFEVADSAAIAEPPRVQF
jgi:LemA protein